MLIDADCIDPEGTARAILEEDPIQRVCQVSGNGQIDVDVGQMDLRYGGQVPTVVGESIVVGARVEVKIDDFEVCRKLCGLGTRLRLNVDDSRLGPVEQLRICIITFR